MEKEPTRKYKAFISYRHKPLDMSVAQKIQKTIERYVIPEDLRENGQKKLGYVFRDQSELTASSDLAEIIHEALDNSEYLIVICTPDAAKSEWVNEEISYFLTNHDREHVLAVLVAGEPEESFPPALTQDIAEDGTVRYVEPLAANIVAGSSFSRSLIYRGEILRIIAALMDCSYDTLYRRDHRYTVIRRTSIIGFLLLMAAFDIGLLIRSNLRIKSSYQQSLVNQSVYYAAESQRLLDSGDRFSAIKLAMEALPSQGNDRPLVSQAVFALSQAENIYKAPSDEEMTGATGMLSHNSPVENYLVSSDGSLLCSKTDENIVTMWETSTMRQLWKTQVASSATSRVLRISDNGTVCLCSGTELMLLNSRTGETIWKKDARQLDPGADSFYLNGIIAPAGSDEVILNTPHTYYVISLTDGSVICGFPAPSFTVNGAEVNNFMNVSSVSEDGKYMAATFSYYNEGHREAVAVIDVHTGQVLSVWTGLPGSIYEMRICLIPEEDIYIVSYTSDRFEPETYDPDVLSYKIRTVCGIGMGSAAKLWEHSDEYVISGSRSDIMYTKAHDGSCVVVNTYSNKVDIYDMLSGEKIGSAESASDIAGTRADSGIITAVTENGDRMLIDISVPEYWRSSRLFVSSLKSAAIAPSGVWVLQNNSEDIVCYSTVASDPLWSEYNISMLSEQGTGLYQIDTLVQDGIAAFLYVNMQGRYSVILGDGSPSSSLREVILQDKLYGEPMTSCTIEDFYDGKLFLSWETDSRWGYMDIDLSTLKTETSYPEKYAEAIFSGYAGKGRFCIVYPEDMPGYDENKYHLCILNSAAETVNSTFLGRYSPGCSISCTFDPQGMIYAVIPQANTVKKIDPMIGTRLDVPVGFADMLLDLSDRDLNFSSDIAWSDDSSFTASMISPTQIRVSDSEGNRLFTVDEDVLRIGFFTFTSDNRFLLVMGSDDRLRRYDVRTGDLAGSLKLYAESYSGMYEYSFPENRDFMTVLVGDTLNLVSLSDWEIFGYVGDCIGYQRTNDLFVCYKEDSDISYGCFPRYSVQMLLDHGLELLGGWDPSHEQRTAFGVGDPD